jgi:excisionase family DNA binding protein
MRTTKSKSKNEILAKLNELEILLKKKDDKPLNFNQAAEYLGFSQSYLYKLTSRKIIPCYRPTGKVLFFSKAELDEWVFGREHSAKGKAIDENEDEEDEPP